MRRRGSSPATALRVIAYKRRMRQPGRNAAGPTLRRCPLVRQGIRRWSCNCGHGCLDSGNIDHTLAAEWSLAERVGFNCFRYLVDLP